MKKKEPLFAEQRQEEILKIIESEEKVTVAKLSEIFAVSGSTIRSDLRELEQNKKLKRTHGGAIALTKTAYELDIAHKKNLMTTEKRKIAELACSMIEDGDTILLDTGTTCYQLALLLGEKKDLTVITNDFDIEAVLEHFPLVNLHFVGGEVRRGHHCTTGPDSVAMLENFHADKVFLGVNSVSIQDGLRTPDIYMAELKRKMIKIGTKVILLCDHTKFGQNSFVKICNLVEVDTIITDASIDPAYRNGIEEQGVQIMTAEHVK